MGEAATTQRHWTREAYLAFERSQPEKHELYDGQLLAMTGASLPHNEIVANLIGELRGRLRGTSCRVLPSDMRVRIPDQDRYVYPDVSIVCGPPQLEDDEQDTLLNPSTLFEVLSDSTERYDRGRKFADYRTIPSFKEYVLVAQDRVLVEQYTREDDGTWRMRILGKKDILSLSSPVEIPIDELYDGVSFDTRSLRA